MLKVCESKAFAKELKVFDLQNIPLPYSDNFFDYVVCCGVLHFFDDLGKILEDVSRIIKPEGIFGFTVAALTSHEKARTDEHLKGFLKTKTPWGVPIFKHSDRYVTTMLPTYGFDKLKTQKILMRGGPEVDSDDMPFRVYVAREASVVRVFQDGP
jgi:ubiquinone/menaquinone biosynthesis C-methylase UbiE